MKKAVVWILVFVFLAIYVFVCYADEPIPFELEKRIHFVSDECFIVRDDGTVFMNRAAKDAFPDVLEWKDIQAISVDTSTVVGLRTDGTVVATGSDNNFGVLDVTNWKNIVEVAADLWCTYALNSDGELIHTGEIFSEDRETFYKYEWKNLKQIVAEAGYLFALTNDGHVISTYDDDFTQLEDVQHMFAEDMGVDFIHGDGAHSFYSIYGGGFVYINENKTPLSQTSMYSGRSIDLDIHGNIHSSEFSPYYQLDADNIIAVCGGIYVDKDGVLYSIEVIDADEPLPTFDLSRYQ